MREVYLEERDFARARLFLERAVAILEHVLGPQSPDLAESTVNLSELLLETGEYAPGKAGFERTLKILEGSVGAEHPSVARAATGLATLDARAGDPGPALDFALRSEHVGREHLRLTGRSFTEEQALRYAAVRSGGLDLALTLALSATPPADAGGRVLDALVRSRAVVLDGMAARHHSVVATRDPAVARLAETLAAARARLANLTVRGIGALDPEQYRALLSTEGLKLEFTADAIEAIADVAATINARAQNIGARRLHTVIPGVGQVQILGVGGDAVTFGVGGSAEALARALASGKVLAPEEGAPPGAAQGRQMRYRLLP